MYTFDFNQNKFFKVFLFEALFPSRLRRLFGSLAGVGLFLTVIIDVYMLSRSVLAGALATPLPAIPVSPRIFGTFFCLFLVVRLVVLAIQSYSRSKTDEKEGEGDDSNLARRMSLSAAEFWFWGVFQSHESSTRSLLFMLARTETGRDTFFRLGIVPSEYDDFLLTKTNFFTLEEFLSSVQKAIPSGTAITSSDIFSVFFALDADFSNFFLQKNIGVDDINAAARWADQALQLRDVQKRWWKREHLGRVQGIGKNWAYGYTTFLERFAYPLRIKGDFSRIHLIAKDRQIQLLESALLKQSGANVIIVGQPGTGRHTLLMGLARKISEGSVFPALEGKRLLQMLGPAVIAAGKEKGQTQEIFLKILSEASEAGNVILIIDEFHEFVHSLEAFEISAAELLGPFLERPTIHILAIASTAGFRRTLEPQKDFIKYFEKIEIAEPELPDLIQILQDTVPLVEGIVGFQTLTTYSALRTIAEGARQYLVSGGLTERAVNLLEGSVKDAVIAHEPFVSANRVLEYLKRKTRIPLGEIDTEERNKLLNLEKLLHQNVIDQEEAIGAIADAIRRARVAIQTRERPIGSFLFLGPTGVGKTQTAKALAAAYFGNIEAMTRFDMTEYQSEEALERLIGSFERNEPGILATTLRSVPYGVILLDEFEKTHHTVMDLFLQILDEGFFTDAFGERVNMRNSIIIATSNAGALLISDLIKQGVNITEAKNRIIDEVLKTGIFKPELLNRFDSVILFKLLQQEQLLQVARFMLEDLTLRLHEKNIELEITDELVRAVAQGGFDPAFGARPMRRFIQDHIENKIAEKMIAGEILPGARFTLPLQVK